MSDGSCQNWIYDHDGRAYDHGGRAGYSPPLDREEVVMHLGVVHEIRDPAGWDAVMSGDLNLPPGFALLGSVTQDDARRAMCIWEAPSLDDLQRLLDGAFGAAVVNDCFVADPARSVNLPTPQTTTARA
jgi:hypothetical protein